MLHCSSRGEASFCRLLGVCSQLAFMPVFSSALLQNANTWDFMGLLCPVRRKNLVLAPIMLLDDGLNGSLGVLLKDQVLQEDGSCSLLSFPHSL